MSKRTTPRRVELCLPDLSRCDREGTRIRGGFDMSITYRPDTIDGIL